MINNHKLLKISLYPFGSNSRDAREIAVAMEAGFKSINVVCFEGQSELTPNTGWNICELKRPVKSFFILYYFRRIKTLFSFIKKSRKINADVISGHDLFGLLVGYLSNMFKEKKAKLIYDAHEYELGRHTIKKRGRLSRRMIALLEKYLIKKSEFTIVVNNSIYMQMQNDYDLTFPACVVRNIPINRPINKHLSMKIRTKWLKTLELSDVNYLLMYHGNIGVGRGIELAILLCSRISYIGLILLGDGSIEYKIELENYANSLGVANRILFQSSVSGEDLGTYISASDVGFVVIPNVSISYYFAQPNKLFETIHAGNPVITSNFPEMENIVILYGIGETASPDNLDIIEKKIRKLLEPHRYKECKINIEKAKYKLTWENEKKELLNWYKDLFNNLL